MVRNRKGRSSRAASLPPSWLRWNDGCVMKLARTIDEEARFQDLPVLADALEEAGCSDAGLIGHHRGPGQHVRGCWALYAALGRQ